MEITRIDLPVSADLRMSKVTTATGDLWVVSGPTTAIADAVKAGGVHIMTRRGPRVILVDRVVKLVTGLAIVPLEVDFSEAKTTSTAKQVTELSDDELAAEMARRQATKTNGTKTTTSRGKANGASKARGASKAAATKPAEVTEVTTVDGAADLDDADLDELLV